LSVPESHIRRMGDKVVKFTAVKRGERQWVIEAELPNGKLEFITGFLDEHSTKVWLASEHCDHWLTVRGHKKST
jgi:hypothetical protein